MACFLVPTAEAIVTTVIAKTAKEEKDYTNVSIFLSNFHKALKQEQRFPKKLRRCPL